MPIHSKLFAYLAPDDNQLASMTEAREAAREYAETIERIVPDGITKDYIMRELRTVAMWVNAAITRDDDGAPRV